MTNGDHSSSRVTKLSNQFSRMAQGQIESRSNKAERTAASAPNPPPTRLRKNGASRTKH